MPLKGVMMKKLLRFPTYLAIPLPSAPFEIEVVAVLSGVKFSQESESWGPESCFEILVAIFVILEYAAGFIRNLRRNEPSRAAPVPTGVEYGDMPGRDTNGAYASPTFSAFPE